jgi:hypothetical protein
MTKTIELKDDPRSLEHRIASVLSSNTASAADLVALIKETETVIADAEAEHAVDPRTTRPAITDTMFVANRLGPLLQKLQARYQEVHEQDESEKWLAEREANWLAEYDALKVLRDSLVEELRDVYPEPTRRMADLFVRIAANNKALDELNRTRPEGVHRHLLSVELAARGLDGFSVNTPSLLTSVCLFDWDTGRQIFPPPRQSMGTAFAAAMMPASDRLFSGDWWKEKEDGAAIQRAQQQSMADYYERMTVEQEQRENAEARERFAAHQAKKSV